MFSKLKIKPRDLFFAFLLLTPLLALGYISYNPSEQAAIKEDEHKRSVVNSLAKASQIYKDEFDVYPNDLKELYSSGVLDWEPSSHFFLKSSDEEIIIFTKANSLSYVEYCSGEDTNFLYSSVEKRTDIVCGEDVAAGEQKFIN